MSNPSPSSTHRQSIRYPDKSRACRLQLQERDLRILRQVHEDRFLTALQLTRLFFPSYEMAKKRLHKLWNAGYLRREFSPVTFGTSPAIYGLTAAGKDLLLERGVLTPEELRWHKDRNRGTSPFKQHELALNDLKVAFTVACQASVEIHLHHFGRGAAYQDRVRNPQPEGGEKDYIPICPDGFVVLEQERAYHYLFLEVDRGTMALRRVRSKLKGYREYYFQGGFFAKYGQAGYRKEDYSFRVLMTCPSEETRNNRLEQACRIGSNTMCLFAVQEAAVLNPFAPIWIRGKEYKEALKHLPPEQEYAWSQTYDKRERDAFIRERVPLVSLIEI